MDTGAGDRCPQAARACSPRSHVFGAVGFDIGVVAHDRAAGHGTSASPIVVITRPVTTGEKEPDRPREERGGEETDGRRVGTTLNALLPRSGNIIPSRSSQPEARRWCQACDDVLGVHACSSRPGVVSVALDVQRGPPEPHRRRGGRVGRSGPTFAPEPSRRGRHVLSCWWDRWSGRCCSAGPATWRRSARDRWAGASLTRVT